MTKKKVKGLLIDLDMDENWQWRSNFQNPEFKRGFRRSDKFYIKFKVEI